jgi:hypothetical protein
MHYLVSHATLRRLESLHTTIRSLHVQIITTRMNPMYEQSYHVRRVLGPRTHRVPVAMSTEITQLPKTSHASARESAVKGRSWIKSRPIGIGSAPGDQVRQEGIVSFVWRK